MFSSENAEMGVKTTRKNSVKNHTDLNACKLDTTPQHKKLILTS